MAWDQGKLAHDESQRALSARRGQCRENSTTFYRYRNPRRQWEPLRKHGLQHWGAEKFPGVFGYQSEMSTHFTNRSAHNFIFVFNPFPNPKWWWTRRAQGLRFVLCRVQVWPLAILLRCHHGEILTHTNSSSSMGASPSLLFATFSLGV